MYFKSFIKKIKNPTPFNKIFLFIIFSVGLTTGFFIKELLIVNKKSWINYDTENTNISLCFTPPKGCANLISEEIKQAKKDIFIQAYVLTHESIINAILYSRNNGVKINILLDYKSYKQNIKSYKLFKSKGININFDNMSGLAHNKIIIIDKKKVITGSFNFTNAADKRNAENVVLINDSKIASEFLNNWINRKITSIEKLSKKLSFVKNKNNKKHKVILN